ncbi:FAD-dependent oxidoreductase [Granulicella cerasi]|uniref:FAD-dependent oxidoreductase n=1 Tax=Granulicella cerasi TaxID=741063 RepID=A0ABW1Z820_9BACT|nr:FAD-dependent oxidoreductase [Granulicella cerasi]
MIVAEELAGIKIFDCMDEQMRRRMALHAADVHLEDGEYALRDGQEPYFFVLLDGDLTLIKEHLGHSQEMHHYKRGDFFGEIPLLLGAPAFASVKAKGPTRLARFERQDFHEMIRESEECGAIILKTLNNRLSSVQERALNWPVNRVLVVGSQYDTDCRDIRTFLTMNRIPYEWIDREREPERVPGCMSPEHKGPAVVIDQSYCLGESPTVRNVAERLGFKVEPSQEEYDVVVVGGGPAGLAAAVYGASEGLRVLLIERAAAGGQAATSSRIENYLGFPSGISGDELSDRAIRQARQFGAEIVLTREVKKIDPIQHSRYCVELDGGQRVSTRTVILATGVDWRRLQADGIDPLIGRGVLYGASRTEAATVQGKDVFIVGGGNSAGQAAMFFANYAKSVTLVVRGEGLHLTMSQYLIGQLELRKNVEMLNYAVITRVDGDGHLERLWIQRNGGEAVEYTADALFVMIGADANTDWLPKSLQRDERGYICTGRDVSDLPNWKGTRTPYLLETNLPGIFCAGDVRHDSIKRVSSGVGEGSMAIAFVHQYLSMMDNQNAAV